MTIGFQIEEDLGIYSLSLIYSQNILGLHLLKNKNAQTNTKDFSNILTCSKRRLIILESDRGTEFHNSVLQNILRGKNIHHNSRFTDEDLSIAERVLRTSRILSKKPVYLQGKADWLIERTSVIEQ